MTPQVKKMVMNIATGVLIFGAIGVGYTVFFKEKTDTATPETPAPVLGVAQTVAVSSDIARTKAELSELKKTVAASINVFSSREFRSLEDFTLQVPEEPIGRDNPFMSTDWKLKIKAEEAAAASKKTASGSGSVVTTVAETPVVKTSPIGESSTIIGI